MGYYYKRGERVEVTNKEEGLEGSYYTANIISSLSDKDYIIQYKTLTKEEDHLSGGLLREVVSTDQIRPLPPDIPTTGFSKFDIVDAYEKDGWWVGKIMGKEKRGSCSSNKYLVLFENTGEHMAYPLGMLRFHLDWVNGHWVSSNK